MKAMEAHGWSVPVEVHDVIVFGSGAAGLCCAKRLADLGVRDILLLTNGIHMGTSRNTGSDKQTYYKLNVSGSTPDSVVEVAQTLVDGGACDGDAALVEAALSARCFYHLADLGVPFVRNGYGEFVGYKTDHDPKARAASAGPLTVQEMCAALFRQVERAGIPVREGMTPVKILTEDGRATGLLCLWQSADRREQEFQLFACRHLVMATGAPASLYEKSVFPESQVGASGICFEAGVRGKNLTEWQYGLASTGYRWNVSGSYQQVLPRYVSTAEDGSDVREFLLEGFDDIPATLNATFLKGYQWPFDVTKLGSGGSSWVDLLVYRETVLRGRKVYMDFTQNPFGMKQLDRSLLSPECLHYLESSGALQNTPYERLMALNPDAIQLYRSHGIDLEREWLAVDVCAQHNNGGLSADIWWETNVRNLYAIGELNGSHGIRRPGGSALNAGQVGAFRAAEQIATRLKAESAWGQEKDGTSFNSNLPIPQGIDASAPRQAAENAVGGGPFGFAAKCPNPGAERQKPEASRVAESGNEQCSPVLERAALWCSHARGSGNLRELASYFQRRNSGYAGFVRNRTEIEQTLAEAKELLSHPERIHIAHAAELPQAFQLWDMLVSTAAYLGAMLDYIQNGGLSRGSALFAERLPEPGDVVPVDSEHRHQIQEVTLNHNFTVQTGWRGVREIPNSPQWFEQVWKDMKQKGECR
ncbi:MAG: FAD-binding protein [Oscillospiraceae bacterium]|jgi:succinate dehydrogenase/fumarate reductase flavoprotein subunit